MSVYTQLSRPRKRTGKVLEFPGPQIRKLLVPREHGSWGLWLFPLFAGAVVGAHATSATLYPAFFWLLGGATAAFLAYQPVEALLGISPLKLRSPEEQQIAGAWILTLSLLGAACAFQLIMLGRARVLWFALVAIACFAMRFLLGPRRAFRAAKQVLGSLALTSTAAAAYYVISGKLDKTALFLWAASWLFASSQIEYVQLRLHSVGVPSASAKLLAGWKVLSLHLTLLAASITLAIAGLIPALFALAFVPALGRLAFWFLDGQSKTNFVALGFSELFQSLAFSGLLTAAFLLPG